MKGTRWLVLLSQTGIAVIPLLNLAGSGLLVLLEDKRIRNFFSETPLFANKLKQGLQKGELTFVILKVAAKVAWCCGRGSEAPSRVPGTPCHHSRDAWWGGSSLQGCGAARVPPAAVGCPDKPALKQLLGNTESLSSKSKQLNARGVLLDQTAFSYQWVPPGLLSVGPPQPCYALVLQ